MAPDPVIQFGSIWGSLCALGFYAVIALVIGLGTGRIMLNGLAGKASESSAHGIMTTLFCHGAGLTLSLGIFAMLHFTSLDGFYGLELRESSIVVHEMFPPRTVELSNDRIVRISGIESNHQQLRLMIELNDGTRLFSAREARGVIEQANEALTYHLGGHEPWQGRTIP